jgi:DNA-binding NarL/FixJ family response regulator
MRIKQGLIDEAKVELQKALSTLPIKDFKQIYQNYFAYSSALKQLIENLNSPKTNLVFSNRVKITNRETDIVELFRDRLTDKDIALKLGISLSTVKRHNINIFNKLQVSSKQQALEVLSKM